jgi:hypothetical protein
MVNHAAIAILAAYACSCVHMQHGDFRMTTLAGNIKGLKTPEGVSVDEINTSQGAAIAKEAISDAASAYVLGKAFDAAGKLIEEGADVLTDNNDTDVEINKSNNAAKVETETFVPPEPVVPE